MRRRGTERVRVWRRGRIAAAIGLIGASGIALEKRFAEFRGCFSFAEFGGMSQPMSA
jgi:hypothetical protein